MTADYYWPIFRKALVGTKGGCMSFDPIEYNELNVSETPIPGFYVVKLPVHGDNRGWFKENYQKEKMEALGCQLSTLCRTILATMWKKA